MRPGQNKRMRGRSNNNNNRKGPNPLTRSYESNGPDVKIRGTAHHIGEKYLQLARDAQSSGDPVMAESYLQHAEHYFRLIAAAQQAQQQAQLGYQRQPGEPQAESEEDNDDDFESLPDRFASPSERQPQQLPPQPQPQPFGGQPFSDRQPYEGQRQDNRSERPERYDHRQNNQPRHDRPQGGDRQQSDRQPYEARDRQYDNRRDRNNYQDRDNRQDRGNYQDRNAADRDAQDRGGQDRGGQDRGGQERGDRPPREYDNRGYRSRNRDFRDGQPREVREPRQGDEPGNGLPAFITAPTRAQPDGEPQPDLPDTNIPAAEAGEDAGLHMRPRRRRRPKGEFAEGGDSEGRQDVPATDPVGD